MDDAKPVDPDRRDFIYIATISVGAIGVGLVAWPLIDQMNPDAAALAPLARCPVETYGLSEDVDWHAHGVTTDPTGTSFQVRRRGAGFGTFALPMLGLHNVRNALAAIAVGSRVGLAPGALAAGLRAFRGVKRRLETVGVRRGVTVLDDFAHHPTAVQETLAALRTGYPSRRIWAVFEPRSASSCRRIFQDDFARAFGGATEVLIAPVFRATLLEAERLSVPQLVRDLNSRGQSAREADSLEDIVDTIVRDHRMGDLVVLMSNGGFGGIHQKLLRTLGER